MPRVSRPSPRSSDGPSLETCPRFVSEMNCCASREGNTSLVRVGRLMSFAYPSRAKRRRSG